MFTVSYNELYEQPNWITYCVRDVPKNVDRKGYNFRKGTRVWTSNNADYKNNIWDKGHLAPAAAFSDSEANLKATFSFLNCTLQHQRLNRKEWAQLEQQVRYWARDFGDMSVEVDVLFESNHQVLPTGAHVPSGFIKRIQFPDGVAKCFYFPNEDTFNKNWTQFEIACD
ncbi:DNA/RNA non-specific endonuclease [Flavobacteriaceae bacterium]|nr:DNA/RNA non-specific endonuclease [Flavobacteriaceae bacterium]